MGGPTSYDLMVFEPDAAPVEYGSFRVWFVEQMECDEGHAYNDSRETSERLRHWYLDMLLLFPSGADAFGENGQEDQEEDNYSGYCIGRQMIYVIFVPSKADAARQTAVDLAAKHGLGVFEPTSERAELWRPEAGTLLLVDQQEIEPPQAVGLWDRLRGKQKANQLSKPRLPSWMS